MNQKIYKKISALFSRKLTPEEVEEADYQAGYKKYMLEAAVGQLDMVGDKITRIYEYNDEFFIYEVEQPSHTLGIRLCIYTKKQKDLTFSNRHSKILPYYMQAKSLLHKVESPANVRTQIASIMAHALSSEDNYDSAAKLFDELFKEINSEFNDRIYNKLTFLYSNVVVSLIFGVTSIIRYQWVINHSPNYSHHHFDILSLLLFILTCASIGGTFSLSAKLRKLATTKSVRWRTYVLYGLERTFIAMAAGFIFFLAVSAHLIFATLIADPKTEQHLFTLLFLSVLAGFSETLVPDLLVTMEKNSKKQQEEENKG